MSAHVVISLLLRGLVEKLMALDYSTLVLLLFSFALPPGFGAIFGKCIVVELMRSYVLSAQLL